MEPSDEVGRLRILLKDLDTEKGPPITLPGKLEQIPWRCIQYFRQAQTLLPWEQDVQLPFPCLIQMRGKEKPCVWLCLSLELTESDLH